MADTKHPETLFYQSLGELFYAIAAADKVVNALEYEALKEIVLKEWKIYDDVKDFYNTPVGYQIEFVFEWLDYEHMDANECFDNFCHYAKTHPKAFNKETVLLILKTAETIANAFAGKNKSELVMLAKLKLLFQNLK